MEWLASASDGQGLSLALVGAATLAGFRHGFDIDHIAAIADITSSQTDRRRSLLFATAYALGHMLVLLALGILAVLAGRRLPAAVDAMAGRVIGGTLIALGLYVVYSLIRFRRDFRMRSRWMLVVAGVRRIVHWVRGTREVVIEHEHEHEHEPGGHHTHAHHAQDPSHHVSAEGVLTASRTHTHSHTHVVPMPEDPFTEYGVRTSMLVGMVHGIGAETPTQVLLFTSAAGLAGTLGGVALVSAFVIGLLLGNTVLAIGATFGLTAGKKMSWFYVGAAATTALVSVYVGVAYLANRTDILPAFLGG